MKKCKNPQCLTQISENAPDFCPDHNTHPHKKEPRRWQIKATLLSIRIKQDVKEMIFAFAEDLLSTREKEVREEILRHLPEERIIHGYRKFQEESKSTEYCEGWNDYRLEVIKGLTNKT